MRSKASREALASDITTLREALEYDPATGSLRWKHRPNSHFENSSAAKKSNNLRANAVVSAFCREGYLVVTIFGVKLRGHRVAWALHHGEWPIGQIDHINHDRTDNRISNLRDVTHSANAQNQRLNSRNTSGCTGVTQIKNSGKWQAQIKHEGRYKYLGAFPDLETAIAVRKAAERILGFHENHGGKP